MKELEKKLTGRHAKKEERDTKDRARLKDAMNMMKAPSSPRIREKVRELEAKIDEFDRMFFSTGEQERKRKELLEQMLKIKGEVSDLRWQCRNEMQWHHEKFTLEDYRRGLSGLSREELEMLLRILSDHLQGVPAPLPGRRSLLELEGLGAEIWRGLDAQEYVNHERDSWTS